MSQIVTINGKDTKDFGVSVMKIKGVFDMPARFGTYERDWKDVDGVEAFVEVGDLYYKQRKISIECIMEASDIAVFQFQLGMFREEVYTRFTMVTPYSSHDCIMKEGAKVKFINDKYGIRIAAKFTLIMNEVSYNFGSTLTGDPDITNDFFWIDNINLRLFGIVVEESDGNFDFPKMKTDKITRYKRESDKVNTRATRNITLKCSMFAPDINVLQVQMAQFHALLALSELRQLMLPMEGLEKPYGVFCADGFKVSKLIQNGNQVVAMFTIVLREAEPTPESFYLSILLDTDGIAILTTDSQYIYVIGDRTDLQQKDVYLFDVLENQPDTNLWTTNELDSGHLDYNVDATETYLFTDEEIGELP